MNRSVFISYSTDDTQIAEQIRDSLEAVGLPCWMAPRDIAPGLEYGGQIIDAIEDCTVLVLVLSESSNRSRFVLNEVERAVSKNKIIIPLRIEPVQPSRGLEFFISNYQWIDGWQLSLGRAVELLTEVIRDHLNSSITSSSMTHAIPPATLVAASSLIFGAADRRTNLPTPLTRLIGRAQEIAAVRDALLRADVRLLTLLGPPGVGKSRLSIEIAHELQAAFNDGVYFVALAPLNDASLVLATVAQSLGVMEMGSQPPLQRLISALRAQRLLLVLDNFEHVLEAAPLVVEVLEACPGLKVLVTSRAALHVRGEHSYVVTPLLPDPAQQATENSSANSAAVELFVERAQAVQPNFVLTAQNAAAVAAICVRLDGLPLAIELAAARTKLLPPEAFLARLEQRLAVLTGGARDLPLRHRTLRSAIAWSYELLDAGEQTLFRRFGVFVGGCTLAAAEAVLADNDTSSDGAAAAIPAFAVLDGLTSLLDKSLIKQEANPAGEPRFFMLETIREYARAELHESGEKESIHRKHLHFYVTLVEAAEPLIKGADRAQALAQVEAEIDNVRAALAWSQLDIEGAEVGLRLSGALAWFAHFANHATEARSWLAAALQRATAPTAAHAKARWGAGLVALILANFAAASAELEQSVALWRQIGERLGLAVALRELTYLALSQADVAEAQRRGEESVSLCRRGGDQWDLALSLFNLGHVRLGQHDYEASLALFQESYALSELLQDPWCISNALAGLGYVRGYQGDYASARSQLEKAAQLRGAAEDRWSIAELQSLLGEVVQLQGELEQASAVHGKALMLAHEIGNVAQMAHSLRLLARIALAQRQEERAVQLFAAAEATLEITSGTVAHTFTAPHDFQQQIELLRTHLGEKSFEAKWAGGYALKPEQAIEYALGYTLGAQS